MARTKKASKGDKPAEHAAGICAIGVKGFKSLLGQTEIAIRPLTLLAGANSSGKSSVMQAPLLLKQTLEAPYDPGALLMDGPHVRFTAVEQMLSRVKNKKPAQKIAFKITKADGGWISIRFARQNSSLEIEEMSGGESGDTAFVLRQGISHAKAAGLLSSSDRRYIESFAKRHRVRYRVAVRRERCFLRLSAVAKSHDKSVVVTTSLYSVDDEIRAIIHVPALRGNPLRTYKTTAVGAELPGTFEPYVASVISHWQTTRDTRLKQLGDALEKLGLTWKVEAARIDDTQVALRVGRLRHGTRTGARDLVSIADVGFGLSQCLPVVVALLTARPGQLVYLEEPEIHLHPRAQVALAHLLADAAIRGVRVVVETHSSLLLLGVQSLVAEGALPRDLVALHWFSQTPDGMTEVKSAELDETGAFGDWPEDFDEVVLAAQSRYLDAAEARAAKR